MTTHHTCLTLQTIGLHVVICTSLCLEAANDMNKQVASCIHDAAGALRSSISFYSDQLWAAALGNFRYDR